MAGLDQQQAQPVPLQREALLIFSQHHGVLQHPRHRAPVQRQQVLAAGQGGDHRHRVLQLRGAGHRRVAEVGANAEQLAEVRVLGVERLEDLGLAGQHHHALQRNGLGAQHLHGAGAELIIQLFQANQARPQALLERGPGAGLLEHGARGEHQEAAVGLMQHPGAQVGEVGGEGAELHLAGDGAEEVGEGGVNLLEHRHGMAPGVGDELVHLEAQQRVDGGLRQLAGRGGRRGLLFPEGVDVLDGGLAKARQVGEGLGRGGPAGLQRRQQAGEHLAGGGAVDLGVPGPGLERQRDEAPVGLLHQLGDAGQVLGDGGALGLADVRAAAIDGATPHPQHGLELPLAAAHVEAQRVELGPERDQGVLLFVHGLLVGGGVEAAEAAAVRHPGKLVADGGDDLGHGLHERRRLARGQAHRQRAVGPGLVEDVDPVVGRRPGRGGGDAPREDGVDLAQVGLAGGEDVEAVGAGGGGDLQSGAGAGLQAHRDLGALGGGLDVGGGLEGEARRVDAHAHLLGAERVGAFGKKWVSHAPASRAACRPGSVTGCGGAGR